MNKLLALLALLPAFCMAAYAQEIPKAKIGVQSAGSPEVKLKLVARIQSFNAHPANAHDIFDPTINSPKSALIIEKTDSGKVFKKLYINNLEGGVTSVYDMNDTLVKIAEINHTFSAADSGLFKETNFPGYQFKIKKDAPNIFTGKPVEMCTSNNGKYLWVPYYRRDYDFRGNRTVGHCLDRCRQ